MSTVIRPVSKSQLQLLSGTDMRLKFSSNVFPPQLTHQKSRNLK